MTLELSFIPLGLPSLVYFIVQRRRGRSTRDVLTVLGLRGCDWRFVLLGVAGGALTPAVFGALSSLGVVSIDFETSMSALAAYRHMPRTAGTFFLVLLLEGVGTALGEELLFRGLLAGVLMKRLGFWRGNVAQATLFALVHLVVLFTAPRLAVLAVLVSFAGGLFMGWLRGRTDSILPAWATHASGFPVALFLLL